MARRNPGGRSRQEGFSLIELIVVITIIGILATAVVINVGGQDDKARVGIVKADFQAILTACNMYKLDHKRWPETLDELLNPPSGQPYIRNRPLDPWTEQEYIYEITDRGPRLVSFGADQTEGASGGDEVNEDLFSDDLGGGR